jgi:solute carrier family 25 phosphate transporter 3
MLLRLLLISCILCLVAAESVDLGTTSSRSSPVGSWRLKKGRSSPTPSKQCNESPIGSQSARSLELKGGSTVSTALETLDYRYFLAGGLCAAFSHGVTTPIDVVKTKIQASPEVYKRGMLDATSKIVRSEGFSFLLTGLAATVVGYGIEGALKFGFYEMFKGVFAAVTASPFVAFLLASVVAGAVASLGLCPMEDARIRMVGDKDYAKDNLLQAMARIVHRHGLRSAFSGLGAMLAKQIPYTMAKQVSFDMFAARISKLVEARGADPASFAFYITTAAAMCASVLACIFSHPGDVLLTAASSKHNKGLRGNAADIYRRGGFKGFFAGVDARLVHCIFIITIQLVVYAQIKAAVGLPITGSH